MIFHWSYNARNRIQIMLSMYFLIEGGQRVKIMPDKSIHLDQMRLPFASSRCLLLLDRTRSWRLYAKWIASLHEQTPSHILPSSKYARFSQTFLAMKSGKRLIACFKVRAFEWMEIQNVFMDYSYYGISR